MNELGSQIYVWGESGSGKSMLVQHVIQQIQKEREKAKEKEWLVMILNSANTIEFLRDRMTDCAKRFEKKLFGGNTRNDDEVLNWFKEYLESEDSPNWIIVYDDLKDVSKTHVFYPNPFNKGIYIFTSIHE